MKIYSLQGLLVPDWPNPLFLLSDIYGTVALSLECHSVLMSKIKNNGLGQSGT